MRRLFAKISNNRQGFHEGVPTEIRRNLIHLYFDIGWYGVLAGSGIAFLSIFAARLGASTTQVGLVNAIPALVIILLALPAAGWLEGQSIHRSVFITSVLNRAGYLFIGLLPWFLSDKWQVWGILSVVLVMSIPGTPLQVGFNALFAAAVPNEYRGLAAGVRNAVYAITTTVTSVVAGIILNHFEFPLGFQIVFAIGFAGAMMSSFHLWKIRIVEPKKLPVARRSNESIIAQIKRMLRLDILRSPFKRTIIALTVFHFVQYLPVPLFPVYAVRVAEFSDLTISIGNAVFYTSMFFASTQLERFSRLKGYRWITGTGMMMLGLYPLILSTTHTAAMYYLVSLVGGSAWAFAGGTLFNYLLERVPNDDRPGHLAWFNLTANAAVLTGSLLGPIISEGTGIILALVIFAILRIVAGASILRWG